MEQAQNHPALLPLTQVDVVDSRFAALREEIHAVRDFVEADAAHRAYVDSLVTQTFLDLRQLGQIVEAIFGACTRFAALVQVRARDRERVSGPLAVCLGAGACFWARTCCNCHCS